MGADLVLLGGALKVTQAFAVDLALEGADGTVVDREAVVGDDEALVDFDDTSESAAFRAGTDGGVEGEKRGDGGTEGLSGLGGTEPLGEFGELGAFCIQYVDASFAEVERILGGFDEAGAVARIDFYSVLDDQDGGWEVLRF